MKRLRLRLVVLLLITTIPLIWLTATESGLRWAYRQAKPYLPDELTMNTLEGRLIGPITAKGIEYQQAGALIKADQVEFNWRPGVLLLTTIDITRLHIRSLKIVLPRAKKTDQPVSLPDIHLPWRLVLMDAAIDGFSLSRNDQTFALNQIRLNATTLFSKIDVEELSISADTFNLNIKGELRPTRNYHHDLEIDWQATLPSQVVINGNGQLSGNTETTRIKQHLSGAMQLTLDAELNDMLNQPNWQAKVDATQFDASLLNANWPTLGGALKLDAKGDLGTATLSGTFKGEYPGLGTLDAGFELQRLSDNSIQIDLLKLHAPGNDTRLDARGQWVPASNGGDIKLALNWQNLQWPMQEPPWFNSASGSGTIEGNIDHYQIKLTSDSPWPQTAPSTWYASAEGDIDGLNVHSLRVQAMNGETIATGQLNWSPVLTWKARINATDINPASLWPQWPGQLKARLTSTGRFESGQLTADADISQLNGKLRGYPVSLRSHLSWHNKKLDIALFDLLSGGTQVSLQGTAGMTMKLDWAITSNNLAELYPQAKGELKAKGLVSGPWDTPLINASVNGKALKLLSYEIGAIDGTIAADLFHWQKIDIRLAAQALKLNGYPLQSLNVNADSHRMEAKAVSEAATAQLELKGEAYTKGWRGHLVRADIQSSQFANWQLIAPVAFSIGEKLLVIDKPCWHNNQDGKLCASVGRENMAWRSSIEMNKFPLMPFSHWLHPDLKLEGVADATAELQFQPPDQLLGKAHIELPPGAVSYPLLKEEHERWGYRSAKVDISLNQQGLEATTEIAMSNGDRFKGQLALPGARPLALESQRQPLQGSAQLNTHHLGLIEAFVPEVQNLQGEIALNLTAGGTLAQPKLSGGAQLLNGSLQIPRLGLTISQLSMKGQSDDLNKLDFQIDARSGNGNLAIQGHTLPDRAAGWPTVISVKGTAFEVSRIPEAQVLISPDLQIKLQKHTLDISGDIFIPFAKLQPKDVTTAARVSGDAVIVGGEQPPQQKWSIFTRTRVTLGERVNFYGFGFEGRLGGSLLLVDEPGQLTKATGEINIPEGRYLAYGQRLDIEHGRILFTGGLLTNPGLDLRAVRRVNDITAGLKVRGSLNQPQLELFSIPAMGQTDALAYLLLGHPIEKATGEEGSMMTQAALALGLSGGDQLARTLGEQFGLDEMRIESSENAESGNQASLVMGSYLSPGLYVSYGVGLIEALSTIKVRYQISEKWQLKTESGEHQGADIIYTIKR